MPAFLRCPIYLCNVSFPTTANRVADMITSGA